VAEWVALLQPIGVPVAPINDLAQVFEHPQVLSRGMKIDLPHPLAGTVPLIANPIKFSATPIHYELAPPTLGQHTREVLQGLGMDEEQIQQLLTAGVVAAYDP
jgi:crotonobetainyl-CoA:carnitine CoA-transferase CaiB-like acyl-CoA transferase